MRSWRQTQEKDSNARGVARAAVAGASRQELLSEALTTLTNEGTADRIGVWVEPDSNAQQPAETVTGFHGLVWDRENPSTPKEWTHLSVEAPLPEELWSCGKSVEQDLGGAPERLIIGPLVGLRRALWIPVAKNGSLKGLILAGSRKKELKISREHAESVAAELALAIGLEEERRITQVRTADLGVARQALAAQSGAQPVDTLLSNLAASCTESHRNDPCPGAAFAVIGALTKKGAVQGEGDVIKFQWRSGDSAWTHAAESEPLASVWRRAVEARRVVGGDPQGSLALGPVVRIVAFPLESEGELLGVLVAGLPRGAASLATLDRLELRAVVAAAALHRKKREEEETRRKEWQQALLDSTGEAILLMDNTGKIAALSKGAMRLTSRDSKGGNRRPGGGDSPEYFAELFRARDHAHLEAWLHRALRGALPPGGSNEDPPQAELHNGVRVRVRQVAPAPEGYAGVALECLASREAARSGEYAETELQSVLEWLEEGVLLFDAQENVRAMNTRFAQIAGLAPEETGSIKTLEGLIGRLAGHAAEPEPFAERWRQLARGIEGGIREELQMMRPSPRILERAARPVLDSIGRQLGRVEIYRDLTAQRVFQSKLLQTEKLAALGQMVSGVAHELSNPLTSILGYAQRLLLRREGSGRNEEVRQIFQEAERASAILRQLLLNARETLPERRVVSLNQIALRAMELQRFSLAAEKIRVEIDLDPGLPFVNGDPGQLQQVLMNLLGNARQALEQNGQGGTIRLRTRRNGDQRAVLEVEDNGPGIPPSILARIFDPFFTTKPAGIGTGLGLAIVLSIVREHGGQVNVVSPPQGGAIFRVELPAAARGVGERETTVALEEEPESALHEAERTREFVNSSTAPTVARRSGRVLVVEDEPTVARLIADVLEDEGMRVDVLLDGREALQRAEREEYDLVICDMKMPGLDGQHFYKSLARTGNPLRERFLFVTGDVVAAQTREFLDRNRLPHVAKPFRVEELTDKVHRMLQASFGFEPPAVKEKRNVAGNG